jgi:AAA+ superfamily predicted ATPase
MGELVLAIAFLAAVLLWAAAKSFYGFITRETRQELEEQERLWDDKRQFDKAVLEDRFPSEAVLAALANCHSFTDDDGFHSNRIPDELWHRVPYLHYGIDYCEAVQRVRQQQRAEEERKSVADQYGNMADSFALIVSQCGAPFDEITRAAKALHGDFQSVSFENAIRHDLLQILKSLSVANGTVPEGLGRIYQAVFARLEPKVRLTLADCICTIEQWDHRSVRLPVAIDQLRTFDQMNGDRLSQKVAATYLSFLEAASSCLPNSMAITTVKKQYVGSLAPLVGTPEHRKSSQRPSAAPTCRGLAAVAGMVDLKRQLHEEVVDVFRDPDKYRKYGISIPNGILLFGPPGCGKTYIARQLAAELGCTFNEIAPSDLGSTYVHGTTLKIREMFDAALAKAPCVLFLDEFDALVPDRAGSHQHKGEEVNEFLTQIERCSEKQVLLIAATNRPWEIDAAVQRTGRFDKRVYVAPPDATARGEILAHHLRERFTAVDLNAEEIAAQLDSYSCSDLKVLVDEAAKIALKAGKPIGAEHFDGAMSLVRPSISIADETRYKHFVGAGKSAKLGFQL